MRPSGLILTMLLITGSLSCSGDIRAQSPHTLTTPGAIIHFPAGRKDAALDYLRAFPEVRASLRRRSGAALGKGVIIELVTGIEELRARAEALGGRTPDSFIEGLAFSRQRHVLIRLDASGSTWHRIQGLLTHELAHVAIDEFRMRPDAAAIPRWLDEGIAQYLEGGPVTALFWELPVRARLGFLIPLAELDKAFFEPGGRRAAAYVQAESLTEFMVRAGGGVRELLELLGEGVSLKLAVRKLTFMDLEEIETLWIEDLESDVAATMRSLGPLAFALFIGLASAAGLIRRHRRKLVIEERWAREEEAEAQGPGKD